ncbi:MAG: hypothetical protein K2X44_11385, partial [Magnetospirillum sp.]|nr:hypothetical protein [Magnetospirillum sp.]
RIAIPINCALPVPADFVQEMVEVEPGLNPVVIPAMVGEIHTDYSYVTDDLVTCEMRGEEIPLMQCTPAEVLVVHGFPDAQEASKRRLDFEGTHQSALKMLSDYAGLFGVREVVLHIDVPSVHAPLPVRQKDAIDIMVFSSPAHSPIDGDVLDEICGMPMDAMHGGLPILLHPCPLRGGVLMEKEKGIAQYIDNTLYILFPPTTLDERGGVYASECFKQVLLEILSLWYFKESGRQADQEPRMLPLSLEGIQTEFTRVEATLRAQRVQTIMMIEREIKKLEAEVLDFRRKLHEVRFRNSRPTFYHPPYLGANLEELAEELIRFNVHPQIASIELLSEVGVLVRTSEVHIVHDGKCYRIGTFGILFRYDGFIDIWSLVSFHPEGELHPHIGISSGACYG